MDAALTRFARLSELTATLADALSEEEVVSAVLEQVLDVLGCRAGFVVLPTAAGDELRLVGARGYPDEVVTRWARIPLAARIPAAVTYREGRTVSVDDAVQLHAEFPDLGDPMTLGATLSLPLRGRGGVLGTIGFSFAPERGPVTERDAMYAEALADHCASAVERSQLFAETLEARAAAERSAARASLLQTVTSDLVQARTPRQVAEVLVHKGVVAAGAQAAWVSVVNRAGTVIELLAAEGFPAELTAPFQEVPVAAGGTMVEWARSTEPVWLESADAVAAMYPEFAAPHRDAGLEAVAILPLVAGGESVGFLGVDFRSPRPFDESDRALLETLATLCSQALERALLHEALEDRANASAVLERIGEGVVQLDDAGTILIWNPAAARITGIPSAEATGRRISDVLPDWERLSAPGAEATREALSFTVAGRELWLSFSAVAYEEGSVYAFRDLTGEHALEEARRDFVATASHELRTPLSSVYGAARTLQRRALDPERRDQLISLIADESERLSGILDELLFASRLDAGALTMQVSRCLPATIAREVVALARERAPDLIQLGIAADDGAACLADPARLRQVLVNLVDNAIKYSPDGGSVDVTVRSAAGRLRIEVADRGLGIPASERDRIFEKFFRLDPSLTRGVGGTGLGLYICRQLVEGMGGTIGVDGRPGGGSVFAVELPAD